MEVFSLGIGQIKILKAESVAIPFAKSYMYHMDTQDTVMYYTLLIDSALSLHPEPAAVA